jgi:hypothetical protein
MRRVLIQFLAQAMAAHFQIDALSYIDAFYGDHDAELKQIVDSLIEQEMQDMRSTGEASSKDYLAPYPLPELRLVFST